MKILFHNNDHSKPLLTLEFSFFVALKFTSMLEGHKYFFFLAEACRSRQRMYEERVHLRMVSHQL